MSTTGNFTTDGKPILTASFLREYEELMYNAPIKRLNRGTWTILCFQLAIEGNLSRFYYDNQLEDLAFLFDFMDDLEDLYEQKDNTEVELIINDRFLISFTQFMQLVPITRLIRAIRRLLMNYLINSDGGDVAVVPIEYFNDIEDFLKFLDALVEIYDQAHSLKFRAERLAEDEFHRRRRMNLPLKR